MQLTNTDKLLLHRIDMDTLAMIGNSRKAKEFLKLHPRFVWWNQSNKFVHVYEEVYLESRLDAEEANDEGPEPDSLDDDIRSCV